MRSLFAIVAGFLLAACAGSAQNPVVGGTPQGVRDRYVPDPPDLRVETWVEGLTVPWELAFLTDRALVTERPGRVRLILRGGLVEEPYLEVDAAGPGEAGLMGLAVHPRYPREPFVYVMYTYGAGGRLYNRVERYRDRGREADRFRVESIERLFASPGGGRYGRLRAVVAGPDGALYVSTSNRDGRGRTREGDDRILRIVPR